MNCIIPLKVAKDRTNWNNVCGYVSMQEQTIICIKSTILYFTITAPYNCLFLDIHLIIPYTSLLRLWTLLFYFQHLTCMVDTGRCIYLYTIHVHMYLYRMLMILSNIHLNNACNALIITWNKSGINDISS
jgi:hypothetical protein